MGARETGTVRLGELGSVSTRNAPSRRASGWGWWPKLAGHKNAVVTLAAWRALLDDLVRRGLPTPELIIADGAPGLEKALAALWPDVAIQRCSP